jgi:ABC-type dipeptide/oligopeptide/nickel transport system permease component
VYLVRRLFEAIPVIVAVTFIVFISVRLIPGVTRSAVFFHRTVLPRRDHAPPPCGAEFAHSFVERYTTSPNRHL